MSKIYVLVASGQYTENINGKPATANNIELITASTDKQKIWDLLRSSNPPDVKEPEKWGLRATSAYECELK